MKADLDAHDLLTLDIEGAPRFHEIVAGIGWPDETGHETYALNWYAIIGIQEDGQYAVLAEGSTKDIHTLGSELCDWKDRLLIKRIFADESQPASLRILRDPWQIDGLAGYASHGKSFITRLPKYAHEPKYWTHFRDRDTKAAIISLPADLELGYSLLLALAQEEKIWTRISTPRVEWVLNFEPPLNDIFRHPLLQALSHIICRLEKEKTIQPVAQGKPRYGDKRR